MKTFVRVLSCAESDALLGRYDYEGWSVVSSLADLDGFYGEPKIFTAWQKGNVIVEDTVYWPRDSGRPCEHFLFQEELDVEEL